MNMKDLKRKKCNCGKYPENAVHLCEVKEMCVWFLIIISPLENDRVEPIVLIYINMSKGSPIFSENSC